MSVARGRASRSRSHGRTGSRRPDDGWKKHRVECRANEAYGDYRRHGRMKNGRRLGAHSPPKPYQPPPAPEGKINLTDLDSRNVKTPRGWVQRYNAQAVTTDDQIVIAAEVHVSSADFGQLEPMIAAARRELTRAGIEQAPEVVLAGGVDPVPSDTSGLAALSVLLVDVDGGDRLELGGREVAERRVPARGVVEAFDELEDLADELAAGSPGAPVNEFLLERREEALGDGIDAPIVVKYVFLVLIGRGRRSRLLRASAECVVDLAGEVAFEAADDFAFGFAFGGAAGDVVDGGLVKAHADDY
jgi:hypothetical protein